MGRRDVGTALTAVNPGDMIVTLFIGETLDLMS